MSEVISRQISGLDCNVIEGTPGRKAVLLFHGYGADKTDLVPLARMISQSKDITWVFPNGTMEVIIGPGFRGRAWFAIDMARLERAMRGGSHEDFSDLRPGGLNNARDKAIKLYEELRANFKEVIIGGFSQGAMLATEICLVAKEKPDGLIIMSGVMIDRANWTMAIQTMPGVRYIQSHGKNDPLLGYDQAVALHQTLQEAGWEGEFISFSGGHEIPPKVIEKIAAFV